MPDFPLIDQLELLRAQLEPMIKGSSIIVVSSALDDDGKAILAAGLARTMQAASYRTLLINTDPIHPFITGAVEPLSIGDFVESDIERYVTKVSSISPDILYMTNDDIRHRASRESIQELFRTCRASYDLVIFDVVPTLRNNLAVMLAASADGVLLTICEGRRVHNADIQLASSIQRDNANLIGIVTVSRTMIREERTTINTLLTSNVVQKATTTTTDASGVQKHPKHQAV